MYWAVLGNGRFEIIDGQQRTISICQYVQGDFSIGDIYFHNLQSDQQEIILNYELMVYVCEGTDTEKLDWFRIVNIVGESLTPQELLDAIYHGSWLSNVKIYFSKSNGPAYNIVVCEKAAILDAVLLRLRPFGFRFSPECDAVWCR